MPAKSYITFRLGKETFAIGVSYVREVLDLEEITPLPRAPANVRGIVNLRGGAIPIVDLRTHFGLPPTQPTSHSRIIVMELGDDKHPCLVGGLADAVQEVVEITEAQRSPAPSVGHAWHSDLIDSVALREGVFVLILHVDNLFSGEELGHILHPPSSA